MQPIFEKIYDENGWGNDESVSGNGSTLQATSAIRSVLPLLFDHYDVKRVIDAACGDVNWWHQIEWVNPPLYLGVDVVPTIIRSNIAEWHNLTNYSFEVGDITKTPLSPEEPADLILARDVLVHFSNANVKAALKNIKASNAKYLLATTFPQHHDSGDIKTGEWRPINLAEYWGLGSPLEYINERCDIFGLEDKSLGLWRLK